VYSKLIKVFSFFRTNLLVENDQWVQCLGHIIWPRLAEAIITKQLRKVLSMDFRFMSVFCCCCPKIYRYILWCFLGRHKFLEIGIAGVLCVAGFKSQSFSIIKKNCKHAHFIMKHHEILVGHHSDSSKPSCRL
jgi:hypothetical protein